jgi:hypothetical protein
MTEAKKATINLIHRGYNGLQIAAAITSQFDLLGSDENELARHIEATRKEITEFRAKTQTLAELGFRNGHSWKDVVSALEAPGLLSAFEITQIALEARNKFQAVPSEQALPAVDNKALNQHLIEAALKINPQDSVLQTTLESIREEQAERDEHGW